MMRSTKGLDDNQVAHLKSKVGNLCTRERVRVRVRISVSSPSLLKCGPNVLMRS